MDRLIEAPSLETFQNHVGGSFSVADADGELELTRIDTTNDVVDDWQRFTLIFDGDDGLADDIHRLSSDGLDQFDVALSPNPSMDPRTADDSEPTTREYEAVFNRHEPGRVAGTDADSGSASTDAVAAPQLAADNYIGGIEMFAGNFAPQGFKLCAGQLVSISQDQALFSLIGTNYGGNGSTTFGLPDLRGRAPIGAGTGPGLSPRNLGQRGGRETVTLTTANLAPHTHRPSLTLPVSDDTGEQRTPGENALAALPRGMDPIYTDLDKAGADMYVGGEIATTGDGQPFDTMAPYLTINYVICQQGIYPSRS